MKIPIYVRRRLYVRSLSLWLALTGLHSAAEPADLVIFADRVLTMEGSRPAPAAPTAVAVNGGRIEWLGQPEQGAQYIDAETEVVRLRPGATLIPGLIDAHGHLAFTALSSVLVNVASPPVGPVEDIADLQSTLRDYIRKHAIPTGEWVVGLGYDDSLIAQQRHPTRDDLDEVSTEHPIMLLHVSGHLATANSKALARGGITADTPDPPGGLIRRSSDGEPNGVLEESATYPLRKYMTAPNKDPLQAVSNAMRLYASHGITTVQDGASSADSLRLLNAADAAGKIYLDVHVYPMGQPDPQRVLDTFDFGTYAKRVKVVGVKLMLDGSPQGKTAYLSKPYHVPPDGQDRSYRGYPSIPPPVANDLVATYLAKEIPIIAHANGDAAADMLIEAVALAAPLHDHRTTMIHAQTVREDQLTRMKSLGMIPSYFSAHSFFWGDWHRDSVLGVTRGERISPTASTVARGMVFTVHNDTPIVPPDMVRLLWATTNRLTRSGKVLGAQQRISAYQALLGMTRFAAVQGFEDNTKGTLTPGKVADMTVFSQDPTALDPQDLLQLHIESTWSRGRQVYARRSE
ncbi:MAG: amidohydrolase [Pseudomonadota bacterium]